MEKNLPLYNTYASRLGVIEEIRRDPSDNNLVQVRCTYCNQWFIPLGTAVKSRIAAFNKIGVESRLYCSTGCKLACPTYGKIKYPKGFKHTTSREVSTYLRQLVLERDNWTCQICGETIKDAILHVHHMDPVAQNSMFQNDMDSCITLCKGCHRMVHSRKGCRYIDLICK